MKIKHSQSRTLQIRNYEPLNIMFEVEHECESKNVQKEMDRLKTIIDNKLGEAISKAQADFLAEKANS